MINILDCTLRDGGYYTSWDFDTQLVEDYLAAMEFLPVEFVELGYRSTPQKQYEGEYCYLPLSTLKRCKALCPSKKLAIMINLKDVDENSVDVIFRNTEYNASLEIDKSVDEEYARIIFK